MKVLHPGRRAPEVVLLQRLLNRRLVPAPNLKEDGVFGPKTRSAVESFQQKKPLMQDGVVGPATWTALGLTMDINHLVRLFPQPTNMSCWSAAATMLFGNLSVGPGPAALAAGGLNSASANVRQFANAHGLTMHEAQTWTVHGLAALLRSHGPLWVGGRVPLAGTGPQSGHVVVAGAMWGDGAPDGSGTAVLMYDPWPVGRGSVYPVIYGDRVQQYPLGSAYVLHR